MWLEDEAIGYRRHGLSVIVANNIQEARIKEPYASAVWFYLFFLSFLSIYFVDGYAFDVAIFYCNYLTVYQISWNGFSCKYKAFKFKASFNFINDCQK